MGYSGGKLLRCKGVDIAKVFKKLNEVRGQVYGNEREGGACSEISQKPVFVEWFALSCEKSGNKGKVNEM